MSPRHCLALPTIIDTKTILEDEGLRTSAGIGFSDATVHVSRLIKWMIILSRLRTYISKISELVAAGFVRVTSVVNGSWNSNTAGQ